MEHIEHSHTLMPDNVRISSYAVQHHLPPKTRCNQCCLHHYVPYTTEESHHPAMSFCNGNFCTQTCFSSIQRYGRSHVPTSCSCHAPHPMHSYTPLPPLPPNGCPCCHRHQSNTRSEHRHHHNSHSNLTTDNLTYPTPHYATAYARNPGLHHSWEPTTGYREAEFHLHMDVSGSSTQEYHSHVHHHINHHGNPVCTNRNIIRDQALYTFASRPYHRHHSSRVSSYPYPVPVHHPLDYRYQSYPSITPVLSSYLLPTRSLLPNLDIIAGELEVEPLDDWDEVNGRHSDLRSGLRKEQINKLPSYVVTKKTMEEFTENERCVVCMCEFDIDDKLRILPCAHEFHSECVDKWMQGNPTCPICRAVVEVT